MSTAVITDPDLDLELQSIVPEETESQALVLQSVVALEKIPAGDVTMYSRINRAGLDAATNIKNITALFDRIIPERYAHWKRATELRAKKLSVFEEVKRKASNLIGTYDQEAERARLAEEARLQAIENERARKEQEEQQRLAEAEAKRLSEEQALADAVALEAAGDTKGAEAVLNNPAPVPVYVPAVAATPVVVPKATPKIAGKSSVTTWAYRVKRSPKCKAVGVHDPEECSVCLEEVPRQYLILNKKDVGQIVRAMREKTSIPGIEVFPAGAARFRG